MMGAITPQPASPQEHRYTATLRPTPSGASSGDVGPRMSSGSKPPHPGAACSNRSSPSTRIRTTGQSGVSRPSTRRVRTDTGSLCDETFLIVGRFAVRQNHRLASLVASGYLQCKDPAHEVTLKGTHGRGRSADRIPTRTPRNRSATISHQPEVEHACLDFVIAVTLVALSPPSAALDATGTSPSATKRRQMQREHVPDNHQRDGRQIWAEHPLERRISRIHVDVGKHFLTDPEGGADSTSQPPRPAAQRARRQ